MIDVLNLRVMWIGFMGQIQVFVIWPMEQKFAMVNILFITTMKRTNTVWLKMLMAT